MGEGRASNLVPAGLREIEESLEVNGEVGGHRMQLKTQRKNGLGKGRKCLSRSGSDQVCGENVA